jgi:pSer/pThr/pTyr-binding forkhead associated (FHA) protein
LFVVPAFTRSGTRAWSESGANGGRGNDTVAATVALSAGSTGPLKGEVDGGDGNDNLTFNITGATANVAIDASLDGPGLDTPGATLRAGEHARRPRSEVVVNQSVALFLEACGAAGPLRLSVEQPPGREVLCREFEQPFLLVGRGAGPDLPLDHPAVSRRHAYLQVIGGHVFCLDLHSRTGVLWDGQPRRSGWLEPDRTVDIGPFAVRLLGVGPTAPAEGDPLAALPPDQDPLPPVSLEVRSGTRKNTLWRMDRTLALVGAGAQGTLRVASREMGRPHCALLRTPLGLWVIDLLGPDGVCVNGAPVRCALLEDGDGLLVAGLALGVRYHAAGAPPPAAGVPTPGEAEQFRARLSALEQSLAEASAARDDLVKAGQEAGARWEAERQARAEEQERFDAACRQWQEQLEAAHRQFDQDRRALEGQVERLRQEVAALRLEREALLRQVGAMSCLTVTTVPAPAPTPAVRQDEPAGMDAFFIELGKEKSAGPGGASRSGVRGPPPAGR